MDSVFDRLTRLSRENLNRLSKEIALELRRRRQAEQAGAAAAEASPPTEAAEKLRPLPISPLQAKLRGLSRNNRPRRAA